jgi:hypothetical protein
MTDDLDARLGWLLLCNVWFSLADQIEQHSGPVQHESDGQSDKKSRKRLIPAIEPGEDPDAAAATLGDLLRERLAL